MQDYTVEGTPTSLAKRGQWQMWLFLVCLSLFKGPGWYPHGHSQMII